MRDVHESKPDFGPKPQLGPDACAPTQRQKKSIWNFTRREKQPAVPPGRRVYAVGDIHGFSEPLRCLLGKIFSESESGKYTTDVVFVGDYIDRGPGFARRDRVASRTA